MYSIYIYLDRTDPLKIVCVFSYYSVLSLVLSGPSLNTYNSNNKVVSAVICAALYPNIVKVGAASVLYLEYCFLAKWAYCSGSVLHRFTSWIRIRNMIIVT